MTRIGSRITCLDNTGVILVNVFKKIGSGKVVNRATYGDIVYVCVIGLNRRAKNLEDEKQRKKYKLGSLHKAVIIHNAERFKRTDSTIMWFEKDALVLVDPKGMPLGRKIKTVIPKEIADMYPQIASLSMRVI